MVKYQVLFCLKLFKRILLLSFGTFPLKSIASFFCAVLLWGCADEGAQKPILIKTSEPKFLDSSLGLQNQQEILDFWVYEEDGSKKDLVGVFPIGKDIPIKSVGSKVIFRAGIKSDGVSSLRVNNVLFSEDTLQLSTGVGGIINYTPSFKYNSRLSKTTFREDFESATNTKWATDVPESPSLLVKASGGSELIGNYFAELTAETEDQPLSIRTFDRLTIPFNTPVFLELHYFSTLNISVGVRGVLPNGSTFEQFELVLVPNQNWTKIYVGLTEEVNAFISEPNTTFYLVIRSFGTVKQNDKFGIDNVRLLFLEP